MGRPKLNINPEEVLKLARLHCTMEEMAGFFGCSVDTLENRFSDVINKGRKEGKMKLRDMQLQAAMKGNVVMLIWLGKQMLGQSDKIESKTEVVSENRTTIINVEWADDDSQSEDEKTDAATEAN